MEKKIIFGSWDESIHQEPAQERKIVSAVRESSTRFDVDKQNQSGLYYGSRPNPYQVTLSSCSCKDFIINGKGEKPCKHIYRLAMELGFLDQDCFSDSVKKSIASIQISFRNAIEELERLPESCQLLIKDKLRLKDAPCSFEMLEAYEPLFSCPLVNIERPTKESISNFFTKKAVIAIYEKNNIPIPEQLSKAKLINWCIENHPEVFLSFSFAPSFKKKQPRVYSYLKRKFDWEEFCYGPYILQYPYGSAGHGFGDNTEYAFPDDEITELLTLYGCNRCLNNFRIDLPDLD